jgi:hypothetical protein
LALPTVSRLLGHSNVATTARVYAGVVEGREDVTRALVGAAFARSGDREVATGSDIWRGRKQTPLLCMHVVQ